MTRPTPPSPALFELRTTVATATDAERLATAAVAQRLAACVQVQAIESFYEWDGALQRESEHRLVFKTTAERLDALVEAVRALHPYELPALHALPVAWADERYAGWVAGRVATVSE